MMNSIDEMMKKSIDDAIFQLLIPGCGGNERLMRSATFFDAEMLERVRLSRPDLLDRVAQYIKTGRDEVL